VFNKGARFKCHSVSAVSVESPVGHSGVVELNLPVVPPAGEGLGVSPVTVTRTPLVRVGYAGGGIMATAAPGRSSASGPRCIYVTFSREAAAAEPAGAGRGAARATRSPTFKLATTRLRRSSRHWHWPIKLSSPGVRHGGAGPGALDCRRHGGRARTRTLSMSGIGNSSGFCRRFSSWGHWPARVSQLPGPTPTHWQTRSRSRADEQPE
jgi:hypothetical protein